VSSSPDMSDLSKPLQSFEALFFESLYQLVFGVIGFDEDGDVGDAARMLLFFTLICRRIARKIFA